MSLFHPDIQSLNVHNADETAFGTAESSFSGRDIRCVTKPVATLTQDWIRDTTTRQRIAETKGGILGLKKAKLDFATFLRGTGTAAGNATAALGYAALAEGQLLRNVFGGESLGTGTTINDPAATVNGCTLTDGSGLAVGQAVMIDGEATVLKTVVGNDVTFVRALSAAPANGTAVYASATYYPVQALTHTLQFQIRGAQDDYWDILGCQGTLKLSQFGMGQLIQAVFEFLGASWTKYTGASIATDSYSNNTNPSPVGYASAAYCQDHGTQARNLIDAAAISIDPGLSIAAIESASGVMGIQKFTRSATLPKVEFTTEYSDDWADDFEAQQAKYFHLQVGSTAGQTTLIELPKIYFSQSVVPNAYNSQLGSKIVAEARDDTAAGATDLLQAAIRVHLL